MSKNSAADETLFVVMFLAGIMLLGFVIGFSTGTLVDFGVEPKIEIGWIR